MHVRALVAFLCNITICVVSNTNESFANLVQDQDALLCFNVIDDGGIAFAESVLESMRTANRSKKKRSERVEVIEEVQLNHALGYLKNNVLTSANLDPIKAYAVYQALSKTDVVGIAKYLESPIGKKTLRYRVLTDSLGDAQEAAVKVDFTLSEINELNEQLTNGLLKKHADAGQKIMESFRDSLSRMMDYHIQVIGRIADGDVFHFMIGQPSAPEDMMSDKEREVLRQQKVEKAFESLLDNRSAEKKRYTKEELKRMIDITTAIKIYDRPKPCDQYLCKWGVSGNEVRTTADALGMTLIRDTVVAGERILEYGHCTFYIDPSQGYYKISKRRQSSGSLFVDAISGQVPSDAEGESFLQEWKVIDAETLAGYGKCDSMPSKMIIHARVKRGDVMWKFIECISTAL
jgi:hypothetical protein